MSEAKMKGGFPSRSAAAYHGKRHFGNFMTLLMPGTGWRVIEMPGVSPAAEFAKGKDFVAWVESAHIENGRQPGLQGVVVVTLTQEEIALESIPSEFIVQPQTPSLWDDSPDTELKTTGSVIINGRVRSEAESPVKLVHRLADEMKGKTRAEVIAACVAAGVNKSTAATQYYKWNKAQNA